MKILFITDLYPVKGNEKTTPRTLFDFVREWKAAGNEVDVIKPNFILNSFLRGKPFYKQGNYDGVLNLNFWTPFWGKIKPPAKKYDIVIAHMPSGILYADKLGLPFVAGVHNSDLEILTSPLYKFHFKKRLETALNNAKAIACRSFVIQKKLLALYPEFENKTFVAPSGVDEKLIQSLNASPALAGQARNDELVHSSRFTPHPSPLKILTCANYKKRKNIEKVLEATKGLEGFELTVIGKGTDCKKLRKINPDANFKGYQPHEKVIEEMKKSDIFILPSVGETFGMVYLEAMASGCITIGTKDDGIDGIIRDGENGFLTLPIAKEIRKILLNIKNMDDDRLKVLSYNSFTTIKQFTKKKVCAEYLQQIFKIM